MLRALAKLPLRPELILVDGVLPLRGWSGNQTTLVRGDRGCAAIAAASVLAKVARDALIVRLAERYPGYGLGRHAGYGTAQHREALLAFGPTPLHRLSFLRKLPAGGAGLQPSLSVPGTSAGSLPPVADPPGA